MTYDIEIIRSDRRTLAVEVKHDLRVIVRAPLRLSQRAVQVFIQRNTAWIDEHVEAMRQRQACEEAAHPAPPFTEDEIRALTRQAAEVIPPKVAAIASVLNVDYGRVTIRHQVSRWGSCSAKGNLNFNCLLMLAPDEVIDYVIIHELCHRQQLNHTPSFWTLVEMHCPNYKQYRHWLREEGNILIRRLRAYHGRSSRGIDMA